MLKYVFTTCVNSTHSTCFLTVLRHAFKNLFSGYHELPPSAPQVVLPQITSTSSQSAYPHYVPQQQTPANRPHRPPHQSPSHPSTARYPTNTFFMGLAQSEAVYLGGIITLLMGLVMICYCLPMKVETVFQCCFPLSILLFSLLCCCCCFFLRRGRVETTFLKLL